MSNYDDDDDYHHMQLLEELLESDGEDDPEEVAKALEIEATTIDMSEVYKQNSIKLGDEFKDEFVGYNIDECNSMLSLNKQLLRSLLDLKKRISSAFQKCQRKLAIVDTALETNSLCGLRILICNAGLPYFRDRSFFVPPGNDDELLKKSRGEMQVEYISKVYPWTSKERNKLLKAIHQEAIAEVLDPLDIESSESDSVISYSRSRSYKDNKSNKDFLPKDFRELVGPIGFRDFDWFEIATNYFSDKHSPIDCRVMWNAFLHPDINKDCWKKTENSRLKEIARKYKYQDWDRVAKELGTDRTAYQCFIRYNTNKKLPKISNCIWEAKEDEKLLKLIDTFKIGDFVPWGEVASWMGNRTKQQVYFRWTYSLAPYLIKGRFTKMEDNVLKDAVTKFGKNFRKISAALMPGRSTVQLSDHYQRITTNKIKQPNKWTLEDDKKILELYEDVGPNWSMIAKAFACKTRTQVRHRYTTLQKRKKKGVIIFKDHENDHSIRDTEGKGENGEEERRLDEPTDSDSECYITQDTDHEDFNDDIDKDLIEYFRFQRMTEKPDFPEKLYKPDELRCVTKTLYEILQVLNAKLNIPDNINYLKLSARERQLLRSLKEYIAAKNDKERNLSLMEKCSLLMFGLDCNEQKGTHFIPPLPFDSYIRARKLNDSHLIDYNLNMSRKFLIERPTDIVTPDFVISNIGGNEVQLQFQKFSSLLQFKSMSQTKQNVIRKIYILSPEMLMHKTNNLKGNLKEDSLKRTESAFHSEMVPGTSGKDNTSYHKNTKSNLNRNNKSNKLQEQPTKSIVPYSLLEEPPYYPSVPYIDTVTEEEYEDEEERPRGIEATYASLLAFKNILYFKQLYCQKDKYNELESIYAKTEAFQNACNLLEMRLELLFKYPLCLSKTILPQVHGTDTFSYDDSKKRRANRKMKYVDIKKIKLEGHR